MRYRKRKKAAAQVMVMTVAVVAVLAALLKQAVGAGLAARGLDTDALDRDFPPMDTQN